MKNTSHHLASLGPVALIVLGASVAACGARSTMGFEPDEDEPPVARGQGGSGGHTGFGTGGQGGTYAITGGTGGYAVPTGGTGGYTFVIGGVGGNTVAAGGRPGTGGTRPFVTGGGPGTGGNWPFGTGGRAGTGGTRPIATGGAGGGVIGRCAYVSCLWDLIRDCNAAGPCIREDSSVTGTEVLSRLCCENGVDEAIKMSVLPTGSFTGAMSVTRKGKQCYIVQFDFNTDMSSGSFVWIDPKGEVVAKGRPVGGDGAVRIDCANGDSQTLPAGCSPDGSNSSQITSGKCP